jgi:hypothetical protein
MRTDAGGEGEGWATPRLLGCNEFNHMMLQELLRLDAAPQRGGLPRRSRLHGRRAAAPFEPLPVPLISRRFRRGAAGYSSPM